MNEGKKVKSLESGTDQICAGWHGTYLRWMATVLDEDLLYVFLDSPWAQIGLHPSDPVVQSMFELMVCIVFAQDVTEAVVKSLIFVNIEGHFLDISEFPWLEFGVFGGCIIAERGSDTFCPFLPCGKGPDLSPSGKN